MAKVSELYGGTGEGRFLNAQLCDEKEYWDTELTIKMHDIREIRGQRKLVLGFNEIPDLLVVNKTNALILAEAFGDDTENWMLQKIMLRKTKRNFQGKLVDAIEVVPIKKKGKGAKQ